MFSFHSYGFFYHDGVYNINELATLSCDKEPCIVRMWESLSKKHKIPLYICMTAALRRGIENYQKQLQKNDDSIDDIFSSFHVSGLVEIMGNVFFCDRVIRF